MPLIYPWRTAYGEDSSIHSVLCRMSSGGVHGWGESAPFAAPCYSPEWGGGIYSVLEQWLAPALVGHDVTSGEHLQELLSIYKGNYFAKAALDTAWWALASTMVGKPLHEFIGATRNEVVVGADFGVMDRVEDLLDSIDDAVAERFPRIKLKFRPGWDIDMLEAVRKRFPDSTFHIDCNSGYQLTDAMMFRELDRFNLAMIEQPLPHDDLLDHSTLQQTIETPICLDESITAPRHARSAAALKSCKYINVKPGRVGGMTNAIKIHDICKSANIPCWVGGMLESAVGAAHCVALAMLDNFTYPADIFPSRRFYHDDLGAPALELSSLDGVPSVSAHKELPLPDHERLSQLTVQKRILTPA